MNFLVMVGKVYVRTGCKVQLINGRLQILVVYLKHEVVYYRSKKISANL
jgi:hypothetical protein